LTRRSPAMIHFRSATADASELLGFSTATRIPMIPTEPPDGGLGTR
jgi:hypothetical protein